MTQRDEVLTAREVGADLRCSRAHVYELARGRVSGVHKKLANLEDLGKGYSGIWFVVKNRRIAERLSLLIQNRFRDESTQILERVRFTMLAEFQQPAIWKMTPRPRP